MVQQKVFKRKVPSEIFVVFYPESEYASVNTKKNRVYIDSVVKANFPSAQKMGSRSTQELIYCFNFGPKWDYASKRSFFVRLKSLFLLTEEFSPHFTTYEL